MKKFISIILTLLLFSNSSLFGQSYEPLELAKKIFSKDSFTNIENFVIGEYKGQPNGQDIQQGAITKFKLLGQNDRIAVVNMTITDSLGKGFDSYLHFEKDSIWKMSAFRALSMTGIIEEVVKELERMTPKQIDEIIKQSKSKQGKDEMFKSREDYDFELRNAKLTIELDDNIEKHFFTNQPEFEIIKNLALKELDTLKLDEERSAELLENHKTEYRKLFISSISAGGYELGNGINFLIGGMVDNSVGYLFVKDKKDLPEMNSDRIIMIREIGNGWYIYKTT